MDKELYESYKKFPIKLYKNTDGTYSYENSFMSGKADSLEDLFNEFSSNQFVNDLLYFYDDVDDVQLGNYEPSITKTKGREYLGKLNLRLHLLPTNSVHSVNYLSKNKDEIPNQSKYIHDLKRKKNIQTTIDRIKSSFKKIGKLFIHEMFYPVKSYNEVTCTYCNKPIKAGVYYDNFRHRPYHLECLWDRTTNKETDTYENAKEYFASLQRYLDRWPGNGLDVEEDYLSDLQLVKHNYRITNDIYGLKNLEELLREVDDEEI